MHNKSCKTRYYMPTSVSVCPLRCLYAHFGVCMPTSVSVCPLRYLYSMPTSTPLNSIHSFGVQFGPQHRFGYFVLTWPHMTSHGFTWPHMSSHGLTWPHMASHGLTCPHMASHGFTWLHMASHGLTWPHCWKYYEFRGLISIDTHQIYDKYM